jgi:hypothetical protein
MNESKDRSCSGECGAENRENTMNQQHEQKLILSMAGKIFASKGGSEKHAVEQAKDILEKVRRHPELEHDLVAEVAATIFASPTKSGTKENIEAAVSQATGLFNAVFHS